MASYQVVVCNADGFTLTHQVIKEKGLQGPPLPKATEASSPTLVEGTHFGSWQNCYFVGAMDSILRKEHQDPCLQTTFIDRGDLTNLRSCSCNAYHHLNPHSGNGTPPDASLSRVTSIQPANSSKISSTPASPAQDSPSGTEGPNAKTPPRRSLMSAKKRVTKRKASEEDRDGKGGSHPLEAVDVPKLGRFDTVEIDRDVYETLLAAGFDGRIEADGVGTVTLAAAEIRAFVRDRKVGPKTKAEGFSLCSYAGCPRQRSKELSQRTNEPYKRCDLHVAAENYWKQVERDSAKTR